VGMGEVRFGKRVALTVRLGADGLPDAAGCDLPVFHLEEVVLAAKGSLGYEGRWPGLGRRNGGRTPGLSPLSHHWQIPIMATDWLRFLDLR
jgi:hypothetical protein